MGTAFFYLSRGFSAAAYYSLFPFLLGILKQSFGLSLSESSLAIAASLLAARLLGSYAGAVCDRIGASNFIVVSNALAAATVLVLLLMPSHHSAYVGIILLFRGAIGAGQGIAYRVAALERLGSEGAVRAFALLNMAANAGVVFGPAFSVFAPPLARGPLVIPCALHLFAAIASLGMTRLQKTGDGANHERPAAQSGSLWESLKSLGGAFCISYLAQWIFLQQLLIALSYYCEAQLGSRDYASFFFSFQAALSLGGLALFARYSRSVDRHGLEKIFIIGCLAHSLSFLLVPQQSGLPAWILMGIFALGITASEIVSAPISDAYIAAASGSSGVSAGFGAATLLQAIGMATGTLAGGLLLTAVEQDGRLRHYWIILAGASFCIYAFSLALARRKPQFADTAIQ